MFIFFFYHAHTHVPGAMPFIHMLDLALFVPDNNTAHTVQEYTIMTRNIRQFFNPHSFLGKLFLSFLLASVIPVLCIGIFSYVTSARIARDKISTSLVAANNQIFHSIDDRLAQLERVAESLQYYVYILSNTPQTPVTTYLSNYEYVRKFVSSLTDSFNLMDIHIYLPDDYIISNEGFTFKKTSELASIGLTLDDFPSYTMTNLQWGLFLDKNILFASRGQRVVESFISCYRALPDKNTGKASSVYFVNINKNELSSILASLSIAPEITTGIINDKNMIVAHTDVTRVGRYWNPIPSDAVQSLESRRVTASSPKPCRFLAGSC